MILGDDVLTPIARAAIRPPESTPDDVILAGLARLGLRRWSPEWRRAYRRAVELWVELGGADVEQACVRCGELYMGRRFNAEHGTPCPACRAARVAA